jgi:hypothetical protein
MNVCVKELNLHTEESGGELVGWFIGEETVQKTV